MIKVILNINKTSDYIRVWWRLVTYKRRWYIIGKNVIGSRQNDNNHVISNIMIWSKTLQEKYRKTSHINMHSTKKTQFYPDYSFLLQLFHSILSIQRYPTYPSLTHPCNYSKPVQVYPTQSSQPDQFHSNRLIPFYYTNHTLPHPFRSTPPISHCSVSLTLPHQKCKNKQK